MSKLPRPEVERKKIPSLGNKVTEFQGTLESFKTPEGVSSVKLDCSEVTGFCPVTHQPDFYHIVITYIPQEKCIESKSLKLYLQTFRERGIFCEAISAEIAKKILTEIEPIWVQVVVTQTPRGGISIEGRSLLKA